MDVNPADNSAASNGHHDAILERYSIQENGYGSPPPDNLYVKQRTDVKNGEAMQPQHPHSIYKDRTKNLEAASSLPKGNGSRTETDARQCEAWKIEDSSPERVKDCSQIGNAHSEVTRIVPLKPQRSKKSLNKENKGAAKPQTQAEPGGGAFGADAQMQKSRQGPSCETERRVDRVSLQENATATKRQSEAAASHQQQTPLHQQELRDSRDATGQSQRTRGGTIHQDHFQTYSEFKENPLFSFKYSTSQPPAPTAPPRSLPLKTQWSREGGRQSSADISHIHYRIAGQDAASKRKQAVNHLPPPPPPRLSPGSQNIA